MTTERPRHGFLQWRVWIHALISSLFPFGSDRVKYDESNRGWGVNSAFHISDIIFRQKYPLEQWQHLRSLLCLSCSFLPPWIYETYVFSLSLKRKLFVPEKQTREQWENVCVCVWQWLLWKGETLCDFGSGVSPAQKTLRGQVPTLRLLTPLPHNFPLTEQMYERRRKSECKFETNTAGPALQHHCQSSQTDFHFHLTSLTRDNLAAGHSDCSGLRLSFISFRDERRWKKTVIIKKNEDDTFFLIKFHS